MKTLSIIVLSAILSTSAYAAYTGPSSTAYTKGDVKTALNSKDDTKMYLEGYIVNHLRKDKYTFKDVTGTIVVEIDDDLLHAIDVSDKTMVKVYGEVDKDFSDIDFDVKKIELAK